jgi:hypothetical protein
MKLPEEMATSLTVMFRTTGVAETFVGGAAPACTTTNAIHRTLSEAAAACAADNHVERVEQQWAAQRVVGRGHRP